MTERLEHLIAGYVEGALSQGERQELTRLVSSDPQAMERLAEQVKVHRTLEFLTRRTPETERRTAMRILQSVQAKKRPAGRRETRRRSSFRRNWTWIAAAAAIVVGIFLYGSRAKEERPEVQAPPPRKTPEAPVVKVVPPPSAEARIERLQGKAFLGKNEVAEGAEIAPGQSLEVAELAEVRLSDGTRLILGPNTTIASLSPATDRGRTITVERGRVEADVAKQPDGRSIVFLTPNAEARVLGTRLALVVTPTSSRLEVQEGRVEFVRLVNPVNLIVDGGFYAVAEKGVPFTLRPLGEQEPPADPDVDQATLDRAIQRASGWLLDQSNLDEIFETDGRTQGAPKFSVLELAILALVQVGFNETEPKLKELLDIMLNRPLQSTYTVALQAMALQKLDPIQYRHRIAQCAQFLVDNQAKNGQWCYGAPTPTVVPPGTIVVMRDPEFDKRPPSGDNSNSHFAALGLRACAAAGIKIDREVLELGLKWWIESQCSDGSWGYQKGDGFKAGRPKNPPSESKPGFGSMTVGAIAAMCIYSQLLDREYKRDPSILAGIDWTARRFSVTQNPNSDNWYRYNLFGLERAGILYGTAQFGSNEWYPAGANHLLGAQRAEGFWGRPEIEVRSRVIETCFAVLFLTRATVLR